MASRKGSKPKGNSYENKIAIKIREALIPFVGPDAPFSSDIASNLVHRTPQSGGGVERGDIIIKSPVWKWWPWFIECRNRESWTWAQIMKQGEESIIGKWFIEDALGKCHPYDGDSHYPRVPLLVFTRNYDQDYFLALTSDIINHGFKYRAETYNLATCFNPVVWLNVLGYQAVIGSFDKLLELTFVDEDIIKSDINEYLGDTNEDESPDSS